MLMIASHNILFHRFTIWSGIEMSRFDAETDADVIVTANLTCGCGCGCGYVERQRLAHDKSSVVVFGGWSWSSVLKVSQDSGFQKAQLRAPYNYYKVPVP